MGKKKLEVNRSETITELPRIKYVLTFYKERKKSKRFWNWKWGYKLADTKSEREKRRNSRGRKRSGRVDCS